MVVLLASLSFASAVNTSENEINPLDAEITIVKPNAHVYIFNIQIAPLPSQGSFNAIVIGIAMISLLVGGIGIANTMYTSVLERTKEIGIMKAVGAKNSDILWIFLIESGLLGLVGGIVGAGIGLGGAIGISSIANQSIGGELFIVSPDYFLLICSVLFSFIVGIISGVLPAFQASKLNVVEALRK